MFGRGSFGVGRSTHSLAGRSFNSASTFAGSAAGTPSLYQAGSCGPVRRSTSPGLHAELCRRRRRPACARRTGTVQVAVVADDEHGVVVVNGGAEEAVRRSLGSVLRRLEALDQIPAVRGRVVGPGFQRQPAVEALHVADRRGVAVAAEEQDLLRLRQPEQGVAGHAATDSAPASSAPTSGRPRRTPRCRRAVDRAGRRRTGRLSCEPGRRRAASWPAAAAVLSSFSCVQALLGGE